MAITSARRRQHGPPSAGPSGRAATGGPSPGLRTGTERTTPARLTDSELTMLALAADPDAEIAPDAVPIAVHLGRGDEPLPDWYMPAPTARRGSRWRVAVVVSLVGTFLVLEILGLCSAYGVVVLG